LNKLRKIIWKNLLTRRVIAFLEKKPFPGSEQQVSWYAVVEFFLRWVDTRDIRLRSSALSFTFLLALFPSVIFIFTLMAYLPLTDNVHDLIVFLEAVMPQNAFETIESTLEDIVNKQRGGLLSFGFLAAMYFSTNGFEALMRLLDRYDVAKKKKRSFWKKRLVAIILSALVSLSLLISVLFLTLGNYAIRLLRDFEYFPTQAAPLILTSLNYIIVIVIVFFIVSAIYFLAPSGLRKWRFFSPGSIFASSVILVTTITFSAYVNHFNTYNKLYGSIGVLIFVMLLIYINTYILLLGYELNVSIEKTIDQVSKGNPIKSNRIIMLRKSSQSE
jgi:membrane protein